MHRRHLLFLFLHTFFCLATSLTPEGIALLSLKSAADPFIPSPFSDWFDTDPTPCSWTGVTCSNVSDDVQNPHVVALSVAAKNLRGYIPSELGSLTYLRRLNLHGNNLYGPIPDQLFNNTSLHSLFLYSNNLSGSLPPSLCSLPRLQNLDLSNNSLSGDLPSYLSRCNDLQRLILSANQFSGYIPGRIWTALSNLAQLDLSMNQFTGPIPTAIGELKSLSGTLNLSNNYLSGEIPTSLGNLPVTVSLDLRSNNLSGEIPQTGSFSNQGPTAFLENPLLCGFPLQKTCGNKSSAAARDSPQETDNTGISSHPSSRKGPSQGLIILISVADAAVVALIGLVIIYVYWKRMDSGGGGRGCSCTGKAKLGGSSHRKGCKLLLPCTPRAGRNYESEEADEKSGMGGVGRGIVGGGGDLVAMDKGFEFKLDELLRASAYVLGKSGLGIVYKVVLGNGGLVAVRRLGEGGGDQRYKEFVGEVQAIGRVKHPNVVRLRAYYWATDEKLLISDFVPNGCLASVLRGKSGQPSSSLSWSTRLKIAKGTARGLSYIHECSPRKFVHGDIKPSNILLDNDFHPHISDFGHKRLVTITRNDQPNSSCGLMGGAFPYFRPVQLERSNSYRAPEARGLGGRPTQKWDVYSFGVVLLELLMGKSPELSPTTSTSIEVTDIVKWVRKGFDEEVPLSDMADPVLLQEVHAKKEVLAAFHVALSCTEGDPEVLAAFLDKYFSFTVRENKARKFDMLPWSTSVASLQFR